MASMITVGETSGFGWEHFHHDADIGVRGRGRSVAEAFEQAAVGMTRIVTYSPIAADIQIDVECRQSDLELLFVDWLDAIIYEMATRNMLFGCFAVRVEELALRGSLFGEPVDVARHASACEPKGATLTALKVTQDDSGIWSAQCVIDV
ncbi:archease [Ensifer sesbaniae]|uniref:archease n=1 Tax=Ensifer sesbaniae TaxID=1214071 RepID=UPI0020019AB9|nr:archease [Ensifer sesbaniae]